MDVDSYGMPERIFGSHPEDFYGAVGRIAGLSALLEQQLAAVRHSLARAPQGKFTHQPISKEIQTAHELVDSLPAERRPLVSDYLGRAKAAINCRNDVVHSAFPAQASGELIGHRPDRVKTVTDGGATWTKTSLADLRDLIGQLSQLVLEFNSVYALCHLPTPID